jgi:hypothetical protein
MPQPFSTQMGGQRNQTLTQTKRWLESKSGNDVENLLNDLLNTKWGKPIQTYIHNDLYEKFHSLLETISIQYNGASKQEKSRWLSLVAPLLTQKELIDLGFIMKKKSFWYARKHAKKHGPGNPLPKPIIPPSKVSYIFKTVNENLIFYMFFVRLNQSKTPKHLIYH